MIPNVVSEMQEHVMLKYTSRWFERLPFADGHMDSLIHHYKEFYRPYDGLMKDDSFFEDTEAQASALSLMQESKQEQEIEAVRSAIAACRALAVEYLPHIPLQDRVHFLQLHGDGFIRAHTDESRNSSGIVAGLSMGSGRVMSLTHKRYPKARIDLLLAPRSMYMLCGAARHEWEHSVDWTQDDDEHLRRVQKSHVAVGSPVIFNSKPSGFTRGTRVAMIFRGVSPMELLMTRMAAKQRGSSPTA